MHPGRGLRYPVILVIAAGWLSAPAIAGEQIEGKITYNVTHPSDTKLKEPDLVLSRDMMVGPVKASEKGSLFDGSTQTCIGAMILKADKPVAGNGYCDTVDANNDVWWLRWPAGPTESRWIVVGGTGKYEHLKGEGTTFYPSQTQPAAEHVWTQGYEGQVTLE